MKSCYHNHRAAATVAAAEIIIIIPCGRMQRAFRWITTASSLTSIRSKSSSESGPRSGQSTINLWSKYKTRVICKFFFSSLSSFFFLVEKKEELLGLCRSTTKVYRKAAQFSFLFRFSLSLSPPPLHSPSLCVSASNESSIAMLSSLPRLCQMPTWMLIC